MSCGCDGGMDSWPSRHVRAIDHLELFVDALARRGVDPRERPSEGMPPSIEIEVLRMAATLGVPLTRSDLKKLRARWASFDFGITAP